MLLGCFGLLDWLVSWVVFADVRHLLAVIRFLLGWLN